MKSQLKVVVERFPINGKFIISRGARTEAEVISVTLTSGTLVGRGECVPHSRYGESTESVVKAIEEMRPRLESGITPEELQNIMPSGAARNALDSALWDLRAKLSGVRAHVSAGIPDLKPVTTAFTISLDTPEAMFEATRKASYRPILKIKLGGADGDIERIKAVRAAAPSATLIADANEGWTEANLQEHLNACADAGFSLIEQPVPAAKDEILRNVNRKVPVCADESVKDRSSLHRLVGLYDAVNIKLDKTGGLTEALVMAKEAEDLGFTLMVGCMVGTSLAMAPAMLLSKKAKFVDLDGPLLLARDRENGLRYEGSTVFPPEKSFWG